MKNQKVKLTNKIVNSFKSNTFTADGKRGKAYFIQEETAPGLNLRVQPTWKNKQGNELEGSKTWIFRHHSRRDKTVKDWKIGRASDITLEKAKQEVSAIKVKLAKGIEPSVERKKKEAEEVHFLKEELGIPIYDSVSITLWKCLKMCNIKTEVIKGWGGLFKQ